MNNSKYTFLLITVFFTACTSPNSVIEGTLPSDKYDRQVVFWVPMEGEHPRPVDSTHIQNNTFRLVISPHNLNKMGIVRVRPHLRLALQEILVFTEAGTVNVHLDSLSRATGTPLNETLQYWKDRKRTYDVESFPEISGTVQSTTLKKPVENIKVNLLFLKHDFTEITQTDKEGRFYFRGIELPDSTWFIIKTNKGKGVMSMNLIPDREKYPEKNF